MSDPGYIGRHRRPIRYAKTRGRAYLCPRHRADVSARWELEELEEHTDSGVESRDTAPVKGNGRARL